ncbi:MAG: DUF177 domain-containing protein [Rhodospirillales bacterium]|nr:DUF177 domain-containing protein [Alphaproteobacteria bacterium]MBL6947736.1 DUF177 domain-containing protein [Rhodospirillales bacterium]
MTDDTPFEFSRPISPDTIGEVERSMEIEATPEECARLAKRFGLNALAALNASLTLSPQKGGRIIHLQGHFRAEVAQTCVITLEPLESAIEGTVDLLYDTSLDGPGAELESFEVDGDEENEIPPEPLTDGQIDAGEAVAEQLALEIDPFPRKPGASLGEYSSGPNKGNSPENGAETGTGAKNSPFAGLAPLKEKLEK